MHNYGVQHAVILDVFITCNPKPTLLNSVISESILNELTQLYALTANATGTASKAECTCKHCLRSSLTLGLR